LKSLPYTYHGVDLMKGGGEQWDPKYRALNPQARVPTLVHDGLNIAQSIAIIEYLEEMFHQPALLPRDPEGRARVRDRKSTRLNSSHQIISYAVFCLKKKKKHNKTPHSAKKKQPQKTTT